MDTRLKNNKKALRLAVFAVTLAAACFAFVAAFYKFRVDEYCAEIGSGFEEEGFISVLFQSNYVLYPEVLEKSGKDVVLEELYLTFRRSLSRGKNRACTLKCGQVSGQQRAVQDKHH